MKIIYIKTFSGSPAIPLLTAMAPPSTIRLKGMAGPGPPLRRSKGFARQAMVPAFGCSYELLEPSGPAYLAFLAACLRVNIQGGE